MVEVQRCCAETRRDLKSAHQRVAELERWGIAQADLIATLTARLAAVALERDKLQREKAGTVIHDIQEGTAA